MRMRNKSSTVVDSELCIIKYREKSEQKKMKKDKISRLFCVVITTKKSNNIYTSIEQHPVLTWRQLLGVIPRIVSNGTKIISCWKWMKERERKTKEVAKTSYLTSVIIIKNESNFIKQEHQLQIECKRSNKFYLQQFVCVLRLLGN